MGSSRVTQLSCGQMGLVQPPHITDTLTSSEAGLGWAGLGLVPTWVPHLLPRTLL